MTLRDLLEGLPEAGRARVAGSADVPVRGLAYSTSAVEEGCLFFCVPGFRVDGHDFAAEAARRGAVALLCERPVDDVPLPQAIVADVRAAMPWIAARFYSHPSRRLDVVGVTGTNGKTTVTHLVRRLMGEAGRSCGLYGTVGAVVGGRAETVERTTPESVDLQRTLWRMAESGDDSCAIEVSSHATVLHRSDCIGFAAAVFTNLTQDHLDFHRTMDEYYEAKLLLFFPEAGPPPVICVVNADDPRGTELRAELAARGRRVVGFGMEGECEYRATGVRFTPAGSEFDVRFPDGSEERVAMPLVGRFNVSNALAALATARELGVPVETLVRGLASAGQVPGRFESVSAGQGFSVIVDYAHTPDSLANVLRTARGITEGGRLIAVFGCGGDRDRGKRPLMGRIATDLADVAIATSDNPRSEDPASILEEVRAGVERREVLEVVEDRRTAIFEAVGRAVAGDTVVIAGKGHEQGQEFEGGRKIPFDDRLVAREALEALAGPVVQAVGAEGQGGGEGGGGAA